MRYRILWTLSIMLTGSSLAAQTRQIYETLPVGKYPVGFRIVTIIDSTRVVLPEYNYSGEKNEGSRFRKIAVHLWYPAKAGSSQRLIVYGDYCYNALLSSTREVIAPARKQAELNSRKGSVERWFGKPAEEDWKKLVETPMLAREEAAPEVGKFPLLIGGLRSLSTSITNEIMASNGYVVAMIQDQSSESFSQSALRVIPDMQFVIDYLNKNGNVDINSIGTFGFSGSGFVQVLFGMFDYRVKAVADIESGIYMEGLYQAFSVSNYYNPTKMRVPFLHLFSRDLSKQEKFIDDFERKTAFCKRYRVLLNQPALHHWDFAAEGYTSCTVLHLRGAEQTNIGKSFEIATLYLLNFFNAELRNDPTAKGFLESKPTLSNYLPSLWDINLLPGKRPAPTSEEFEGIVRKKGITDALNIARTTIKSDSSSDLRTDFVMNRLGYKFLNEKKFDAAIGTFTLNDELHPGIPNWMDSLAEGYEAAGDKENTRQVSKRILDILSKKATLTDAEKSIKVTAEQRSR